MRVAVVGAGIVGLACAEELTRAGHEVTAFDPAPARGATRAAAGMLSPAGEAWHGEHDLLRLGLSSLAMWPGYADRLGTSAVGFRETGTVLVGRDQDDLTVVTSSRQLLAEHGVDADELTRAELRDLEPTVSRRVAGGALLRGDHSVNPRQVAEVLLAGLGDRVVRDTARPVLDGTCTGVVTAGGTSYETDAVVVATGHRMDPEVPQHRLVRPVRGEIIRARTADPPGRTVRAVVHGQPVYVVPRAEGEVVIGATSEEHPVTEQDPAPTVGGVARLLDAARTLLPTLEDAALLEVLARHRPGTPDNGPLIGPTGVPGLFVAAGHYRGGVLLAPVTAAAVRAHLEDGPVPEAAAPFTPDRFERSTA